MIEHCAFRLYGNDVKGNRQREFPNPTRKRVIIPRLRVGLILVLFFLPFGKAISIPSRSNS